MLTANFDNLSWIPEACTVEGEKGLTECSLTSVNNWSFVNIHTEREREIESERERDGKRE